MLLPVEFIGASISQNEIGFRWLLNQRARNLARVSDFSIPVIHKLDHSALPEKWLSVAWHPDWDRAWNEVLA
jgi:hypothetical protein